MILLIYTVQLASGATDVCATTVPEPPSLSDVSGTWLALRESGEMCRLDIDPEKGTGEMICTTGDRLFRTAIRGVVLRHAELTVTLDGNEILSGDVVYGKFATVYGNRPLNFFKLSRVSATLSRIGGELSLHGPPSK